MRSIRQNTLIVFVKYPQAGLVKTRLAKDLGEQEAVVLYERLAKMIIKRTKADVYHQAIFYCPQDKRKEIMAWLGQDLEFQPQERGGLGIKMQEAFRQIFNQGVKKAIIIGTDSPFISKEVISRAFKCLDSNQCVVGPAYDGGYYLLGLSEFNDSIFKDISWSTKDVFIQTMERLKKINFKVSVLEKQLDIDTHQDFIIFKKNVESSSDGEFKEVIRQNVH